MNALAASAAKLLAATSGYKTWIAVAGFALLAIYYAQDGDPSKALEMATAALAAGGIRHAISTSATPK